MDKVQASNIVKNTFEKPFDKSVFISFIKNLLNQIEEAPFTYKGNYIHDSFKEYIASLERIGKYSDGEHKIDILIVHLKKETSIERARTMQRNYIAKYLNGSRGGEMKDAALVAFVSPNTEDWRFSLVKMDYKFEKNAKGKIKVKEEFTPARRWSFLVGTHENSHTAQSRLVPLIADDTRNPTLSELEESFNIEKVTKEFFEKYRELFLRTKEELDKIIKNDSVIKTDFEKKNINTVDFSKKLLGQIVFLYFLQKKGWFGVQRDSEWGTGSKQFLRELFEKKHGSYNNFFNDILEPLFYEALRIDRSHDDHYYSRFNCKIPFLNGGLFDPMNGYDWVKTDILIPNELFSNSKKTKEGDIGDGILDIFDRYNFTVKEDEPLEKEVAIDPELLGKAYEKFNAIRPDNYAEFNKALESGKKGDESKFNKQYGVYYTPREIVHYMCQQSLINYLYTELNDGIVTYEKFGDDQTDMFGNEGKTGQLDLTIEHKSKPVIPKEDIETFIHFGEHVSENEAHVEKSGKETDTYYYKLPDTIRSNAKKIDEKLANIKVCDPAIGSGAFPVGMMSEIVRARNALTPFIKDKDRSVYNFKRECIENSLYGVDIDPGAVEIAKLRLWLSLVVDEDDIKQIKPLPNLDYKIVCGNSLLGVEKNLFNENLFSELERLKPLYFNETNPTKKQEYKKQIDDLISQITNGHSEFDFEVYFSEVFHEKGGFDVVITNPPYLLLQNSNYPKSIITSLSNIYICAQYKVDTYHLFIEKGINVIHKSGTIAYITPNTFMKNKHTSKLRELIHENVLLRNVLLFYIPVFEDPSVDITVFVGVKNINKIIHNNIIHIHEIKNNFNDEVQVFRKYNQSKIKSPEYIFQFDASEHEEMFLSKLKLSTKNLGDIAKTYFGIQTHDRNKYVSSKKISNTFRPVIDGGNIFRYYITQPVEFVDFRPKNIKSGGSEEIFKKERIVVRQIGKYPEGSICPNNLLTLNTVYNIYLIKNEYNLKYLLGIINSKLIKYYWMKSFYDNKNTFPKIKKIPLESIPIKEATSLEQKAIIVLVDNILSITHSEDYLQNQSKQAKVKQYEKKIDRMVYELYGLTEEEIKIVEGESQ